MGAKRTAMRTAGAVLASVLLAACGNEGQPEGNQPAPDVCSEMLSVDSLNGLAQKDRRNALPDGQLNDLSQTRGRISCHVIDKVDVETALIVTVEAIPEDEARAYVAKDRKASVAEGNTCRDLTPGDGVGEGVLCAGKTGATGGEQGAAVSAIFNSRYYFLRLSRKPGQSWDLARGEAMALVKEIDENLAQKLNSAGGST